MSFKVAKRARFLLGGALLLTLVSCGSDGQTGAKAERATATCMAERGFEYVAPSAGSTHISHSETQDLSYIRDWGFGLSTKAFTQGAVGPDLKGYREELHGLYENPNVTIRGALNADQRQSHEEALDGQPDTEEGQPAATVAAESTNVGCAETDVAKALIMRSPVVDELESEFEEAFENVEADPRFAQLDRKIADCVSKDGYEFEGEGSEDDDIFEQLEDNFGPDVSLERVQRTEEEKVKLAAIQSDELAKAEAFYTCGYFAAYTRETTSIVNDYEQAFVDANKEALEKFKE